MSPALVDPSKGDEVKAAIRKQYEDHTIMEASRMPTVRRLPFNQLGLDYISGGGVPWNRMSRFWGGPGTGKTLSVWNLIRNAQNYGEIMHDRFLHQSQIAAMSDDKLLSKQLKGLADQMADQYPQGLECVYVNIENQLDPSYIKELGVDTDRLEVVNSTRVEDIGTQATDLLAAFHVIVFDSCTNAITVEEMAHKDGLYHHPVGVRTFKWGQTLSWLNDRLRDDNILIYIDQIRSQFGMSAHTRMEQERMPGGKMMDHNSSMTLHYVKGSWLFRKPDGSLEPKSPDAKGTTDQQGAFGRVENDGVEVYVKCEKSRVGKGDRTALLHLDKIDGNYDPLHDYVNLAKYFGVVKKTTANSTWYQLPDGQKTQQIRSYLEQNPTVMAAVEDVTLRCAADPQYERDLLASIAA